MVTGHCPSCGELVSVPLPVEPLYSLQSAALLIPGSVSAVKSLLYRHRASPQLGTPQYRLAGRRQHRMLTGNDIKYLRSVVISTHLRRAGSAQASPGAAHGS